MPKQDELPFQTYERLRDEPWPGGRSHAVRLLLQWYGITVEPGSADANLQLQAHMLKEETYASAFNNP